MKKVLALVLAITMMLAIAIPAMAKKEPIEAVKTYEFEVNNANFHCNDIEGENGRVWPDLTAYGVVDGKGNGGGNNKNKMAGTFSVTRDADGSTKWSLDDTVECSCGRTDWITFSNNSGVPNGNNVQFQHDGPSKRRITVQVIYHNETPKCDVTCKNDGAECDFECTCDGVCEKEAKHPGHKPCTLVCGIGHDCPFDKDLTCKGIVHNCDVSLSETVFGPVRLLIVIDDGYLFEHDTLDEWNGGNYVSGGKPISERIYNSKTYNVYYKGDCYCVCDPISCDVACEPCTWKPTSCEHIAVCDNCKEGNGGNHENCEDRNGEKNINYFCLKCKIKLGAYHKGEWDIKVTGWEHSDCPGTCQCPICN